MDSVKHEMFDDAAEVIMNRLKNAAEAVGRVLEVELSELAKKVGPAGISV